MSDYAKNIYIALKDMTPADRMAAYIETVKHPPTNSLDISNLEIYKAIFQEVYPDEFAKAEKTAAEAKTPEKEAAEAKAAEAKAAAFKRAVKAAAEKAANAELANEIRRTLVHGNPEKVLNFDNYAITEFDHLSISDLLKHGLKGGKTRRNRRGRRRGRGRRSLKHYSKRR